MEQGASGICIIYSLGNSGPFKHSGSVENKKQFDSLWSGRQALLSHTQPDEWTAIIAGAQADMQKKKK